MEHKTTDMPKRRTILQSGLSIASAAAITNVFATDATARGRGAHGSASTHADKHSIIRASDSLAVTETTAGKVRGYVRNGVCTFKGIPYAGSTAGAARFMAPMKPTPWTGVRSSMYYGQVSPQAPRSGWSVDENAFMF